MKIPIETNEEKEAWRKKLDYNIEIMKACVAAFPDQSECVWRALFTSVVPSASQREATEQMSATIKAALKLLEDNKPESAGFRGILPPEIFEGGGPAVLDEPPEPPPVPGDKAICLLCGSDDLLQTVHLSTDITGQDNVYVIPKTGQRVILKETCICMKCMRGLVEKALNNYAE